MDEDLVYLATEYLTSSRKTRRGTEIADRLSHAGAPNRRGKSIGKEPPKEASPQKIQHVQVGTVFRTDF